MDWGQFCSKVKFDHKTERVRPMADHPSTANNLDQPQPIVPQKFFPSDQQLGDFVFVWTHDTHLPDKQLAEILSNKIIVI